MTSTMNTDPYGITAVRNRLSAELFTAELLMIGEVGDLAFEDAEDQEGWSASIRTRLLADPDPLAMWRVVLNLTKEHDRALSLQWHWLDAYLEAAGEPAAEARSWREGCEHIDRLKAELADCEAALAQDD